MFGSRWWVGSCARARRGAPAILLTALGACLATSRAGAPSKPMFEFPSTRVLAEIEGKAATLPPIVAGEIPVEGWTLEAQEVSLTWAEPWQPLPDDVWGHAFVADAATEKTKARMTRAMSCVARQLGRFHLKAKAPPPETLQQFMIAACGVVVPQIGSVWVSGDVPEQASDDQTLAEWRHQIKPDLLAHLPAQATDAGFWFGRAHGRAVAMMSFATTKVRWKTLTLVPDAAGDVTFEGVVDEPVEHFTGYVNQGRYGVQTCAIDPGVPRPRFRAVCHVAADDATAWVQLLLTPPKRVLSTTFVQVLVRRATDQPLALDRAPYGESRVVADAPGFSRAILEQLNLVRAQAGFPPVRLSLAQSASATRLAGHYFSAALSSGSGGDETDRIALGLLAGWQVGGMIRDGLFMSSLAPRTRDAGQWLTTALATPMGRATLLAKDVEEVALGPLLMPDAQGLAAVVTGYRLYHGEDHTDDVRRLYGRLLSARQRLGLKPPKRLGGMAAVLAAGLKRVQERQLDADGALQIALEQGVHRFSTGMRGYAIETTSLDALQIPENVIRRPDLYLEIAVAHHKPPGAAWAQMIILVIFADTPGPGLRTQEI